MIISALWVTSSLSTAVIGAIAKLISTIPAIKVIVVSRFVGFVHMR